MGLDEVKADCRLVREQLMKLTGEALTIEAIKHELTENLLPLFEGFIDATVEELDEMSTDVADQGEALDALMDGTGDMLQPETGAKLIGFIELSKAVAAELTALLPKVDDLAKKRVRVLLKNFDQAVTLVTNVVTEITFDKEEDDAPQGAPAPATDDAEQP